MVCHSTKPIFVSIADDTFVNIWKIIIDKSDDSVNDVELISSERISDQLLIGV